METENIWQGAGVGWTEVKSQAVSTQFGYSYGDDLFIRAQDGEDIRIGIDESTLWPQENLTAISIPGGGTCRWARIRIVTASTTQSVTFERFKLIESGFGVSSRGVQSSTGLAMFKKTITVAGNIWGFDGNPGDVSETVGSTNSWTHKIKDARLNAALMGFMMQIPIPLGTCTAYPLTFSIICSYQDGTGGTYATGDQDMKFSVVTEQISGNKVAERVNNVAGSATIPVNRRIDLTAELTDNPAIAEDFEAIPDGISSGTVYSTFDNKLFKITKSPIDISELYEEDMILIRYETLAGWSADLDIWGIIIEGVAYQDGSTI